MRNKTWKNSVNNKLFKKKDYYFKVLFHTKIVTFFPHICDFAILGNTRSCGIHLHEIYGKTYEKNPQIYEKKNKSHKFVKKRSQFYMSKTFFFLSRNRRQKIKK